MRTSSLLTLLTAFVVTVAAALGLFLPGIYRDNAWAIAGWRGNDLITLLVVPVMVWALIAARRGSSGARAVWLGTLAYTAYCYTYYLFGAVFNEAFLLYAAAVALPALVLAFELPRFDRAATTALTDALPWRRSVAAYCVVIAGVMGLLWIGQCVAFMLTGTPPPVIAASGVHTSIVFAVDLTMLVPTQLLAGIWLWQRRPWGLVLATVVQVKGAIYTAALLSMSAFAADAGISGAWDLAPLWGAFFVGSSLCCVALLRRLVHPVAVEAS